MKAILVTACPAGIATSFLAAKRIEQQAKLAGWELTLDVGSSVQPRQVPSKEQIAAADLVLVVASALQEGGDGVAIPAALAGLSIGVAVAKVLTRRWRDALVPVVLGRALATEGASCASSVVPSPRHLAIPVIEQRSL